MKSATLSSALRTHILGIMDGKLGKHKADGPESNYKCPFCRKRNKDGHIGTLHVNVNKNAAICHSCKIRSRDLRTLLRDIVGFWPSQLDVIADMAKGLKRKKFSREIRNILSPRNEERGARVPLPETFVRLTLPPADKIDKRFHSYLARRGIEDELIDAAGIGYCLSGRYAGMLVFPIWESGIPVYFVTRRVFGDGKKTLNPKAPNRTLLYNFDVACKRKKLLIISEGPFDVLSFGNRGVGLLGKTLRATQMDMLEESKAKEFVVCLDADARRECREMAEKLHDRFYNARKISYIPLKEGDPNDHIDVIPRLLRRRKPVTLGGRMSRMMRHA